jgi:hypothetical protein
MRTIVNLLYFFILAIPGMVARTVISAPGSFVEIVPRPRRVIPGHEAEQVAVRVVVSGLLVVDRCAELRSPPLVLTLAIRVEPDCADSRELAEVSSSAVQTLPSPFTSVSAKMRGRFELSSASTRRAQARFSYHPFEPLL